MKTPRDVADWADRLRVACKTTPVVEWVGARSHWRITVSNERVVMTLDWKQTTSGRWVWAGSTLHLDGVRSPLTQGFEHFVRVWKNPEEIENRMPQPAPYTTPVVEVDLEKLPAYIGQVARKVLGEKRDIAPPVVGYVDDNFWAMEFTFPRAVLRAHWSRTSNDPMVTEHMYLIVDGVDKSDLVKGSMEKALAIIDQIPHPGVAGPSGVAGTANTQRDRGVEVRSTHVIRT